MSEWIMRRNCALTPAQTVRAYLAASGLVIAVALVFSVTGHWMVLAFALAELLAMGAVLVRYARHARDFERVVVEDNMLCIEIRDGEDLIQRRLAASLVRFDPYVPCQLVVLHYAGETLTLGRHLPWPARRPFAEALRHACRVSLANGSAAR